jgi:hypothetical protein
VRRWLLVPSLLIAVAASAGEPSFAQYELRVNGGVLAVRAVDLHGAGRRDLVVISKTGAFPNEVRWVSVFRQRTGGRFTPQPDRVWQMDPQAAVFDVGPLGPDRTQLALVYLAGSEVRAYALDGEAQPQPQTLLKVPTLTVFPEPGGLPSWPLIRDWKGTGRPWLGVPQFGQLSLYALGGHGPASAAETVQIYQPTLVFGGDGEQRLVRDYSLQLVYRLPQLFVDDFDGDGRADLIAAWQENVAVHLQDASGRFAQHPSKSLRFDVRTEGEKARRSVLVAPLIADLNQDGRADLILIKISGRLTDRRLVAMIYLNRDGDLPSRPDLRLEHEGFGTTISVQDIDGDGRRDLILPLVRIGVMNLVRNLLTNRVEVSLHAHLFREPGIYRPTPDWTRTFSYQIDLSDGIMLEGAWPHIGGDFNGDGRPDLLVVANGEIAVYPGIGGGAFARDPAARAAVKTSPHLLVEDLNGDRRADLVLWYEGDPAWHGVLRVLMNGGGIERPP